MSEKIVLRGELTDEQLKCSGYHHRQSKQTCAS